MSGSPINFTNTFADSGTASGAQVEANFQDINTYLASTKVTVAYLASTYTESRVGIFLPGTVSGTFKFYVKVPANETWYFTTAQASFNSGAGSYTFAVNNGVGGAAILGSTLTGTNTGAVAAVTSFSPTNVAAATTLEFVIVTSGTVTDISAVLQLKIQLRT